MAVALLVAAGRGERLGADRPKAFVVLAGRPMLEWSARRAARGRRRSSGSSSRCRRASRRRPGVVGVAGGARRARSRCAPRSRPRAGDDEPVVVHDAARPLATPELFARALAALERTAPTRRSPPRRVTDTIKRAGATAARRARRSTARALWAVQTPQVFRRAALERALDVARRRARRRHRRRLARRARRRQRARRRVPAREPQGHDAARPAARRAAPARTLRC